MQPKIEQLIAAPPIESAAGATDEVVIEANQAGVVHLGRLVMQAVKYGTGDPSFQATTDPYTGQRFPFIVTQVTVKGDTFIKSATGIGSQVFSSFRGVQNRIRLPSVHLSAGEKIKIGIEVPAGSPRLQVVAGAPFSPDDRKCDLSTLVPSGYGARANGYALGAKSLALASNSSATLEFQSDTLDGIVDLSRLALQAAAAATGTGGAGPEQLAQQEPDVSELLIVTSIKDKNKNELLKGNGASLELPNMFSNTAQVLWVNLGQQMISTSNKISVTVLNPLANAIDVAGSLPFLPERGGKYAPGDLCP